FWNRTQGGWSALPLPPAGFSTRECLGQTVRCLGVGSAYIADCGDFQAGARGTGGMVARAERKRFDSPARFLQSKRTRPGRADRGTERLSGSSALSGLVSGPNRRRPSLSDGRRVISGVA